MRLFEVNLDNTVVENQKVYLISIEYCEKWNLVKNSETFIFTKNDAHFNFIWKLSKLILAKNGQKLRTNQGEYLMQKILKNT